MPFGNIHLTEDIYEHAQIKSPLRRVISEVAKPELDIVYGIKRSQLFSSAYNLGFNVIADDFPCPVFTGIK